MKKDHWILKKNAHILSIQQNQSGSQSNKRHGENLACNHLLPIRSTGMVWEDKSWEESQQKLLAWITHKLWSQWDQSRRKSMTQDSTGPGMELLTFWPIELEWKGYKKMHGWFWGWITYPLGRKWVQRTITRDTAWSVMKLLTLCQVNRMGTGGKTVRSDTSSKVCMQSLTTWKPTRKN